MAVYRSMYDVPLDLPITKNKIDGTTKSDRNTKSFVNKTNKKIYRKKSTTTHKGNRNDVYDTSSYTESDTTDESEDDEDDDEDDETEYTDEEEISDDEDTSSILSEEEEKQYTNSKQERLKRKTKKKNPARFTTKPVGLRKKEIDRVLSKYGKLNKRERTANIIASKSTPDVMTLSRMAKQIRNKQLYLPKGGYLKTALKTLANGTLHQKRSVLVTKPDLLTSIIKRSEPHVNHHDMDTDTTEEEEEDNQTEDDK